PSNLTFLMCVMTPNHRFERMGYKRDYCSFTTVRLARGCARCSTGTVRVIERTSADQRMNMTTRIVNSAPSKRVMKAACSMVPVGFVCGSRFSGQKVFLAPRQRSYFVETNVYRIFPAASPE